MPTRKWWAATVTGIGTEIIAVIEAGWNEATQIALVGLIVQRAVAWLVPNEK